MTADTEIRPDESKPEQERPRVTLFAGGYVIILTAVLAMVLLVWGLLPAFTRPRMPGDGVDPASYRFDLEHSAIPLDGIIPVLLHREMIPVMTEVVVLDGASLAPEAVADERRKLLVSSDRVIGVTINGASRAYPISVLNVHEIINDTLGGEPIAVTYHWPSDAAMVFDRRIGDRTVSFAVSGLFYNGNMLLYPRNDPATLAPDDGATLVDLTGAPIGGESLYSQLLARAVTGADAQRGIALRVIPAQLTSWGRWIEAHPDTTVAGRDPSLVERRYTQGDPAQRQISDDVDFAPTRMPPADSWAPKTRVIVVEIDGSRRVYPLPFIEKNIDDHDSYSDTLAGATLSFAYDHASQTATVSREDAPESTVYHAYWFAWFAMHPEDDLATDG